MNKLPLLFTGLFLTFGSAWVGLVVYPVANLGKMQPLPDEETNGYFPPTVSGLAIVGQKVYAANGCMECHTQQVRPDPLATDIAKQLGKRQTVARDEIREHTPFLGQYRIGQDLSNFGTRETDPSAIHRHLYAPKSVSDWSNMPSYSYLYENRKIVGQPSAHALQGLTGAFAPKPGYEIVPTQQAEALVAYLLSLNQNYPLPESPEPTAK
ncbi:MAG: cbb3-type cytochrome c oxidase subunit II [bacterium]